MTATTADGERQVTADGAVVGAFGRRAVERVRAGIAALPHRGVPGEVVAGDGEGLRVVVAAADGASPPVAAPPGDSRLAVGRVGPERLGTTAAVIRTGAGSLALATTGQLVNSRRMERELLASGAALRDGTDAEIVTHLVARSRQGTLVNRLVDALLQVRGAFALLLATPDRLIAVRDPLGIRPLTLGWTDGAVMMASESRALEIQGIRDLREVAPGEMVILDEEGMTSLHPFPRVQARPCARELLSLAGADSRVHGASCFRVRRAVGRRLGLQSPATADLVSPLGRSAWAAALGMAERLGIPCVPAVLDRAGASPEGPGGGASLAASAGAVEGARVVLVHDAVDDLPLWRSAVRTLRRAGATEVHARLAAPATIFPCLYGVRVDLLGAHASEEGVAERLRVEMDSDTFGWLEPGVLRACLEGAVEDPCDGCYTGRYPLEHEDLEHPPQLPLFDGA